VTIAALRGAIVRHLDELCLLDAETLVRQRTERYRAAGG
jgi:hypothetical protein